MNGPPPQRQCLLLSLPAEIRLQIYEHVYSTPCSPQFFLRDDSSIQQPLHRWFSHEGVALLRTCRTIYEESLPMLYANATSRIQIYIGSGWPTYQSIGPLSSSNPLFARIQHTEITLHLVDSKHIDPAFYRLGLLARALEPTGDAEAGDGRGGRLKSLKVTFKAVTSYNMEVTGNLVGRKVQTMLRQGFIHGEEDGGIVIVGGLFKRMLSEGVIHAVR